MNRTTISIEVQDEGDKEATIIVRGERNSQIMFEEAFSYKDEKKHSLRLHLLKERFIKTYPLLGESLGILLEEKSGLYGRMPLTFYTKLFKSKIMLDSLELHGRKEIEDFFRNEPEGCRLDELVDFLLSQPDGFTLGLPSHYVFDGHEVVVHRKTREVVIFHT